MAKIDAVSKLTSKNQTTIPTSVRKALGLAEGDRIRFEIIDGGRVEITKEVSVQATDSVVAAYLMFLERDMLERPSKLAPLTRDPKSKELLAEVDLSDWLDSDQLP